MMIVVSEKNIVGRDFRRLVHEKKIIYISYPYNGMDRM